VTTFGLSMLVLRSRDAFHVVEITARSYKRLQRSFVSTEANSS
jgi:hypothetical protein